MRLATRSFKASHREVFFHALAATVAKSATWRPSSHRAARGRFASRYGEAAVAAGFGGLPRDDLPSWASFEEIGKLVATGEILTFEWEPFESERMKDCNRASFVLEVPSRIFDAFFNSPEGYRAQYAHSVERGEAANRSLLTLLETRLLEHEQTRQAVAEGRVEKQHVEASLQAVDAKLWIVEDEPTKRHVCTPGNEILYQVWALARGREGQRAPEGKLLDIKGGWLDKAGHEQRDDWKTYRSEEIRDAGWT